MPRPLARLRPVPGAQDVSGEQGVAQREVGGLDLSGRTGGLPRRSPLRTGLAGRPRIRLKQALMGRGRQK
jgi:hypothetical protein